MSDFPGSGGRASELAGIDDDYEFTNRINVVRTHQIVFFGHIQRACQGRGFDVACISKAFIHPDLLAAKTVFPRLTMPLILIDSPICRLRYFFQEHRISWIAYVHGIKVIRA